MNGLTRGGGTLDVPQTRYDIHAGGGTCIASGAITTGGVKIGNNEIIIAGAVVTRDIPDCAVAAGIPTRVIGYTREALSKHP
jgi:maltose O-acetyltransferase